MTIKLIFLRFMLFQSRFEHALALLGGNRRRIAQARSDEVYWEGELDRELLLRELELH